MAQRPVDLIVGWRTTNDIDEALLGNYIGEVVITPKPIASAIREVFTGRKLPAPRMFYYGERDKYLSDLFGYDTPPNEQN